MTEEIERGLVKRPRGRPPKNTGIPTVADVTFDNPLFDDDIYESDASADPFYDEMESAVKPDGPKAAEYVKPEISRQRAAHFERMEEIEHALVKDAGRFIEHVDNAKAGVPYKQDMSNDPLRPFLDGMQQTEQVFALPLINRLNVRADGYVSEGGAVLDTGQGAQVGAIDSASPHDPNSKSFMVCVNKLCQYREGCLRYRMHNRRDNKFPFHPSECRKDGIYIPLDDSRFTAYDPFNVVEGGGIPTANRW